MTPIKRGGIWGIILLVSMFVNAILSLSLANIDALLLKSIEIVPKSKYENICTMFMWKSDRVLQDTIIGMAYLIQLQFIEKI